MQETIEKANQANENFEASTFVNRLKKSSADEGSVGNSLNSALTGELAIVGAAPNSDDIDPANQRLLGELSGQQRSIQMTCAGFRKTSSGSMREPKTNS